MMRVIILTGNETRHQYFRMKVASDSRFEVCASYCEGTECSLLNRTKANPDSSELEFLHVSSRDQFEKDYFGQLVEELVDLSRPKFITKGEINDPNIVREIISIGADIVVCYGSSLIKSELLDAYKGRFLNVHLGLSPYYRGSGTNVWPMINGELEMIGATFMHIDKGIDTGEIVHQIRADIFLGDGVHSIGNRLISKMTSVYCEIISNFHSLLKESQPDSIGKLYFEKDFDAKACSKLYKNFADKMVENYLKSKNRLTPAYIVENRSIKL